MESMETVQPEYLVGFAIFITCSAYAIWLSINNGTKWGGLRWAEEQTWSTVVIGVLIVIAWGSMVDDHTETEKWLLRFTLAGLPMIFRSLTLQLAKIQKANNVLKDKE